jgi:hypothetical protein
MAVGVVDRFEIVDVEHDQPDRMAVATHLEMGFRVLKRQSGLDPSELGTSQSSSVDA